MGLLDDAIREHLELKRRRGADPAEIERAEQEALGPVRRDLQPIEDEPLDEHLDYDDEAGYDFLADEEEGGRGYSDQYNEPPSPALSDVPERAREHSAEHHPGASPDEEANRGQDTVEYRADLPDEPEKRGDEMLEETPEFLQDTPDHDRLWFEQRRPRDFDFDS